jgi:hypothetical protein
MSVLQKLPGANQIEEWFGYWPSFHDAEVLKLDLRRSPEPSSLVLDVWRTRDDVGVDGSFQRDRFAEVRIIFSDILLLEISEWNHQNVLAHLDVSEIADGILVVLSSSFGVEGRIVARNIRLEIEPLEDFSES